VWTGVSSDRQKGGGGGLSLQTLLISSAAAVTAASIVPMFWAQGTLVATAMTPVVVALVSEALKKPAERITAVTPRVARRTATGAAMRRFEPDAARTRRPDRVGARGEGPERFEPLPPEVRPETPAPRSDDPFGLREPRRAARPRLKLALATGLLAFLAAAAVVTASELTIFDGSVSGERGKTSLFGGGQARERKAEPTATPEVTPTGEETPTPSATPTPAAEETQTPAPADTPAPAEPAPAPAVPTPAG
jgi:hypothetical protein